jgi:hypothetical protein
MAANGVLCQLCGGRQKKTNKENEHRTSHHLAAAMATTILMHCFGHTCGACWCVPERCGMARTYVCTDALHKNNSLSPSRPRKEMLDLPIEGRGVYKKTIDRLASSPAGDMSVVLQDENII